MEVRQLMEREVVTIGVNDTLDVAEDVMRLGRIRHMPVVSGGRLVGILSQRDLFRAGVSSLLRLREEAQRDWLAKVSVRDVMTTEVHRIGPDASVREAVERMITHKIGCLPVVENDELVGLLSESDCMRHLARLLRIDETKHGLPELSGG